MKYIRLGKEGREVCRIVVGCMRITDKPLSRVEEQLKTSLDSGVNMFDHADIYGGGESETRFKEAAQKLGISREKIVLQSKCGIRKGMYDFSKEHILSSVEGSLKRLGTDYLDVLLLHRPDALADPEEVDGAFDELYRSGKVKAFGVSNFSARQTELFNRGRYPIVANQLQFSLMHSGMVDEGLNVNMAKAESVERGGEILDYCRLKNITVQAWSPLNYGMFEGIFVGNDKFPELNKELSRLAEKYGCAPSAVAFAWILRHPAGMQVIAGTTDPARLKQLCVSADISLTREEWYSLFLSTGKTLP